MSVHSGSLVRLGAVRRVPGRGAGYCHDLLLYLRLAQQDQPEEDVPAAGQEHAGRSGPDWGTRYEDGSTGDGYGTGTAARSVKHWWWKTARIYDADRSKGVYVGFV